MRLSMRHLLGALMMTLCLDGCALTFTRPPDGAQLTETWDHAFYRPASAAKRQGIPLVVYLHGCGQDAWHSVRATRLLEWAERLGFAVLMPNQSRLRNGWKCWNWWLGQDNWEADEVVALVHRHQREFGLDRARTFVMGLSAGGLLTAHMMACYGHEFRAGGIFSGGAFDALGLPKRASDAWSGASPHDARELGRRALQCMKRTGDPQPVSVLVVHGGSDWITREPNGRQVAEQFAAANQLLRFHHVDGGDAPRIIKERWLQEGARGHQAHHIQFATVEGARVELLEVPSLGHAWSGGPSMLPFADADGPDATAWALRFFGLLETQ